MGSETRYTVSGRSTFNINNGHVKSGLNLPGANSYRVLFYYKIIISP